MTKASAARNKRQRGIITFVTDYSQDVRVVPIGSGRATIEMDGWVVVDDGTFSARKCDPVTGDWLRMPLRVRTDAQGNITGDREAVLREALERAIRGA